MAYVYKKFNSSDIAKVPFNAHKQYNFPSSSAASNKLTFYSARYTSESISLYSSASSAYGSDIKNVTKYNQLDHLFYKDHLKKVDSKKDFISYTKQKRDLYERVNILSLPSGLYGFEIRKSSFYLSSSQHEITDDSYGNLIISGTNTDNYPNNPQQNVFRLDPIKGFKKYDLRVFDGYALVMGGLQTPMLGQDIIGHQYTSKQHYRQGSLNPRASSSYTTNNLRVPVKYYPQDEDDSYYFNLLEYNNIKFKTSSLGSTSHKFPSIKFESNITSSIKAKHNERFNFNTNDDFAISFYLTPQITGSNALEGMPVSESRYILSKGATEKVINSFSETEIVPVSQFPFEIFMRSQSLYFARSDGNSTVTISGEITASGTSSFGRTSHILCQNSSSTMELWFDGTKIASTSYNLTGVTSNKSDLYIGSKGSLTKTDNFNEAVGDFEVGDYIIGGVSDKNPTRYFNGELSNINIWSKSFNSIQIANISESINASPYIGNLFYQSGFATITHPKYHDALRSINLGEGMTIEEDFVVGSEIANGINTVQFQGSHLIYENEYQCTIQEHEFNSTTNLSARSKSDRHAIADFTTSSLFKPYVSTIGLYNEKNELLVIGKLGQPIRVSDETDTTFVVRWDS